MATKKRTEQTPKPGSADAWAENIRARWNAERQEAPEIVETADVADEEDSAS